MGDKRMKASEFFQEAKMLQKWMEDRGIGNLPIELFDKRGNLIETFRFSVDLERQVIEATD